MPAAFPAGGHGEAGGENMSSKDLCLITGNWAYKAGQINVRKIRGADHRIKIQMRVDLGVLQMEVVGRPDGLRPYNRESLLEYHLERIEEHERRNGTDLGFALDPEECREIREEAFQYYQRYLANFVFGDYGAVARDTQRNLAVLDLCSKYAAEEADRYSLEAYRPYIVMMNARSKALAAMKDETYRTALAHVDTGLLTIRDFFRKFGKPKYFRRSGEVQLLKSLRREIREHLPVDPVARLRRQLHRAVKEERYEDAARLRDELESLSKQQHD